MADLDPNLPPAELGAATSLDGDRGDGVWMRLRRRPRLLGTIAAVGAVAAALVYLLVLREDPAAVHVAAIAPNAQERWSAPDGIVRTAWPYEDGVVVETVDEIVAYDLDGSELWRVPDDTEASVSGLAEEAGLALVPAGRELRALDLTSGEERWSRTATGAGIPFGDAVQAAAVREDGTSGTVVLDAATGDLRGEYDGRAVGNSDDLLLIADDDTYRLIGSDGQERWARELEPLGERGDGFVSVAFGADVVALTYESYAGMRGTLVGLDLETGAELWRETGTYESLTEGPDDTVAVLSRDVSTGAAFTEGGAHGELRLYDAGGMQRAQPLSDVRLLTWADVEDSDGFFLDPTTGLVLDADLQVRTTYGADIAGFTKDGLYELNGEDLRLLAWEEERELYTVALDDRPEVLWVLDGAILTHTVGGELRYYR